MLVSCKKVATFHISFSFFDHIIKHSIQSVDTALTGSLSLLFVGSGGDDKVWENLQRLDNGTYECRLCFRHISDKVKARRHFVEQHLEAGYEFVCPECNAVCKTRSSVQGHFRRNHATTLSAADCDNYMRLKGSW